VFASKWNLKLNFKKSKEMVIGKKIDKLKRWDLGNDQIEETNVHKYLGLQNNQHAVAQEIR
jgi:hypothetical protein